MSATKEDLCARWARLVDDEAIGEELGPDDRAFLGAHAAECDACAAEARAWASLASMVSGAALEPAPHRTAPLSPPVPQDRPRVELGPAPPAAGHSPSAPRRLARGAALAAGALAIAAAAWLSLRADTPKEPVRFANLSAPSTPSPASVEHAVALALTSGGSVEIDGRDGAPGAKIAKGSVLFARGGGACVVVDPGVRACVDRGSMIRVADVGSHRRLELLRGRIVAELDPQPAGTSFGVTTRDGTAVAIGTAFAVEVPEGDAPVATRVLHGVVLVTSGSGNEQRVGAHQGTTMRANSPHTSSADDEDRDRALAAPLPSLVAGGRAEPIVFVSKSPGAKAIVDDRIVGVTPLAMLLPPGDHAVVVRGTDTERRTNVHVDGAPAATMTARTIDLATPPPVPAAPVAVVSPVARPSSSEFPAATPPEVAPPPPRASELLVTAREKRAHGDVAGAAAAYRELFAHHPAAPEAHAARVSYGELELASLGDPGAALASFESYLVRGGPLAEEATFGKIRALRALGRTAEERATIDAFLKAYPDSTLAPSLRAKTP